MGFNISQIGAVFSLLISFPHGVGFNRINKQMSEALKEGLKGNIGGRNIWLVDWYNPDNNTFALNTNSAGSTIGLINGLPQMVIRDGLNGKAYLEEVERRIGYAGSLSGNKVGEFLHRGEVLKSLAYTTKV